jgi:hypothetical protein
MKTYMVVWTIELDATSPRDAAQQALLIQRDPESTATVFEIEGELVDAAQNPAT